MTHRRPAPAEIGLRLYRILAGAFPYEFWNEYRDELLHVTEEAIDEIWRRYGFSAWRACFWISRSAFPPNTGLNCARMSAMGCACWPGRRASRLSPSSR